MRNIAYIDGQNLYMATTKAINPWHVDFKRFRIYLRNKYKVDEAYYFIGAYDESNMNLYISLQQAGFILVFRKHGVNLKSAKKGNVDVDLMFFALTDIIERGRDYEQAIIVSGDGDYFRLVEYLISKHRLCKILLPCKKYASSLYKRLGNNYYSYIDTSDMRQLIGE